jgi:hypothetical protein
MSDQTAHTSRTPECLPLQTRLAPLDKINAEARTVEVIFSTGAAVRRRRWTGWDTAVPFDELLEVTREAVDLTWLNAGGPVLDSHNMWSLGAVRGVVDRAWIDGGEARALCRFPSKGTSADADSLWSLIEQRIVRNVSCGYTIDKVRVEPAEGEKVERRIAERWTPKEISFVAVPADPDAQAQVRSDAPMYPVTIVARPQAHNDVAAALVRMRMRQASLVAPI